MAHVAEIKKKTVDEFAELLDKNEVVGVVNMSNLPAKQLQNMRFMLREKGNTLRMTKKRLMKLAFAKSKKKGIAELQKYLKGQPALVFTSENPFKIYQDLQKTKSRAPAKAGQVAPKDIVVTAGPTSFSPGPVIGQLGKYGIKTGIEGGKIVIKADSVVCKEGKPIDGELAGLLTRLGIEPMEIGLDLIAVYEDGVIYESKVLHIDVDDYRNKFMTSYNESFNLAVYVAYPTAETTPVLVGKAANDAKAVAISALYLTDETTAAILQKAHVQMIALSHSLPDEALSDELKSGKVDQITNTPREDKPEEKPKEEEKPDAAAGLGALFG